MKFDVFISHQSDDLSFVEALIDYLVDAGISKKTIFCSSIPDLGCETSIRNDIRKAIDSSKVFLIVLSKNYYASEYCLNEEGIIWYINKTLILINIDDSVTTDSLKGLISPDNLIRNIRKKSDIKVLTKAIFEELGLFMPDDISLKIDNFIMRIQNIKNEKHIYENTTLNISSRFDDKTLLIITRNPKIKIDEISKMLNVSKITVQRIISKLVQNGRIERIGDKRTGYWRIKS